MWHPRDTLPPNHGRYPPVMNSNQRASHARRLTTSSYPMIPPTSLYPYFGPSQQQQQQRNVSLQVPSNYNSAQGVAYPYLLPVQQHLQQQEDGFQNQPQRRQPIGMSHSFSVPWSGYGGSQSKPPSPRQHYQRRRTERRSDGRLSMKDAVKVSAPQDLDGDVFEDYYDGCKEDDQLKRIINYQPTSYWAGRLSSLLDFLTAEYPDETRSWRIKRALKSLNANAYGEGAKHSLDDFRDIYERHVRTGTEW